MTIRKLFAIAWKDAILRFASPSELLFFIILPIVFTFLLAGGTPSNDDDNRIRLVVVDEAQTVLSQDILAELEKSTAVRPDLLPLQEAEEQFDQRRASVLLFIPAGLDLQTMQAGNAQVEFRQQPNTVNAIVARQAVQTALRRVSSAVNAANTALQEAEAIGNFESESDRQAYFEESLELARSMQAEETGRVSVIEGTTPDRV